MGWKETRFVLVEAGGERAIEADARGKPLRLRRLDENNRYQKMILKEGNLNGCYNLQFDNHPQDHCNPASRSRDVLRQTDEDGKNSPSTYYEWIHILLAEKVGNRWESISSDSIDLEWENMKYRTFKVALLNVGTYELLGRNNERPQMIPFEESVRLPDSCVWEMKCVTWNWSAKGFVSALRVARNIVNILVPDKYKYILTAIGIFLDALAKDEIAKRGRAARIEKVKQDISNAYDSSPMG